MEDLDELIKILHILYLLWFKEGSKEGKAWLLEKAMAESEISLVLSIKQENVKKTLDAIVQGGFANLAQNSYKKDVLSIANRGSLLKFIEFVQAFKKNYPGERSISNEAWEMIQTVDKVAAESAYDTATVSFEDAETEGERSGFDTSNWKADLKYLKALGDAIKLVKVSNGIGFKVEKKEMPAFKEQVKLLVSLDQAGVS